MALLTMVLLTKTFTLFLAIFSISLVLVVVEGQTYNAGNDNLPAVPTDIPADTQILYLYTNNIEEFPVSILTTLTAIKEIELNNNNFDHFPQYDIVGDTIEKIYHQQNQLTCVPKTILDALPKLTTLDVSLNPLVSFPETTLLLQPSMKYLYLDLTLLTRFPSMEARNASYFTTRVYIDPIKLYCDCAVAWMFTPPFDRWYLSMDSMPCAGPSDKVQNTTSELATFFATECVVVEKNETWTPAAAVQWTDIPNTDLHLHELRCMRRCMRNQVDCQGFLLKQDQNSGEITCHTMNGGEFKNATQLAGAAFYNVQMTEPEVVSDYTDPCGN